MEEDKIIEEIYEILKNADCDLTHACTSCLIYTHVGEKNELPDEKGRKEAILRIIKLTLQKAKEIGLLTAASQMPKPLGKGMSTDSEIIETLSDLEHEQWMYWSKATLKNLRAMDSDEPDAFINAVTSVEIKWSPNWKPYSELSEEVKEHDRKWARKVFDVQASKIAELEEANNDYVNLNAQNLKRIVDLEKRNEVLEEEVRRLLGNYTETYFLSSLMTWCDKYDEHYGRYPEHELEGRAVKEFIEEEIKKQKQARLRGEE